MKSFRLEEGFEPTTYCFSNEYVHIRLQQSSQLIPLQCDLWSTKMCKQCPTAQTSLVQGPNGPNLIIGWVAFIKVSSFVPLPIAWITALAMGPRSQVLLCFVTALFNVCKYTTFKYINQSLEFVIPYIIPATVFTLTILIHCVLLIINRVKQFHQFTERKQKWKTSQNCPRVVHSIKFLYYSVNKS